MAYSPVTTESFGGIDLVDDPPEVDVSRAVDLLNVDIDRRGRLRQRDGYDNFTSSAHSARFDFVAPFYTIGGTKQLLATTASSTSTDAIVAYDTTGTVVAALDPATGATKYGKPILFGTPSAEVAYIPFIAASSTGITAARWNGTAFTEIASGIPQAYDLLAVQAVDNRMVGARQSDNVIDSSEVGFSVPGDAETLDGTLSIMPGDGEKITALQAWGPYVYAFKQTKYAVFTGNTTDATGGSVFQYEMVNSGDGCTGAACSGRPGVFFLNRRGVYMTQGTGMPALISRALDPLFLGTLPDTFSGSAINQAQITLADMCWMDERLYVAVPTGSATANDRLLVWDSIRDEWTVWNIPAAGVTAFRQGNREELHISYASGSNHVGRQSSSFTNDDGSSISSFWRSGFVDYGTPEQKVLRETVLHGIGSVGYSVATDYGDADTAATVTLGTSPDVAEARDRVARRGRMFSFRLASVSGGAWTVHRVTQHLREGRLPGVKAT